MASAFRNLSACALATAMLASAGGSDAAPRRPPNLEGLWTNAALTTLERPPAFHDLIVPEAQAKAFEAGHSGKPAVSKEVGQEDSEWWDLGRALGRIAGQARSSWIVQPADGRLPYSDAGLAALKARQAQLMSNFDGPEVRPATERCLAGLGGASGPPILNAAYNNHIQIVQTPDNVVIVTEMNHDARIVPLTPPPRFAGPTWSGNPTGHWEGDTLVVVTTGFHSGLGWRAPSPLYMSPAAKVTERFTRTSADEILYAFTVEDPATFTQPWRAEMPLRRTAGPMFEFGCHEGNYSMAGVLAGGREKDREAAGRAP